MQTWRGCNVRCSGTHCTLMHEASCVGARSALHDAVAVAARGCATHAEGFSISFLPLGPGEPGYASLALTTFWHL